LSIAWAIAQAAVIIAISTKGHHPGGFSIMMNTEAASFRTYKTLSGSEVFKNSTFLN
jgi:hypothetical protein